MIVDAAPGRKRTRFWALLMAAALVAGGGVAAVVSVNAHSAETARLCNVALENAATAHNAAQKAVASATDAMIAVENTELPDGGISTDYADRKAVEETDDTEARPSGAELIDEVTSRRDALAEVTEAEYCDDREQSERLTADSEALLAESEALDRAATALRADYAQFQTDETARLTAEKKAAEEAAAEAARVAAEQAAAEEDARQAAQSYSGGAYTGDSSSGGDNTGGGNSVGGTTIAPPPGQSGGGCPPGRPVCYG